jgi:hypothetical protein
MDQYKVLRGCFNLPLLSADALILCRSIVCRRSWIASRCLQALTFADTFIYVQAQQLDGCTPFRREADEHCTLEGKVFSPEMGSWIEQEAEQTRGGVERTQISPFVAVTAPTRECKIARMR